MLEESTNEDRFRAEAASRNLPADETEAWIRDVKELDGGVIHWVIRRRDLAVLRYDRVHRSTDTA
ncbi:hypothetical protein [Nocardiopsis baichengensis]|uniref:hypothetical protein n=1 Tax=Nocardiopsis baichengensis TaxID=280240 RepID=UPI00034D5B08|nr:hypothetical protein [Nocardiopsis baichengensis]